MLSDGEIYVGKVALWRELPLMGDAQIASTYSNHIRFRLGAAVGHRGKLVAAEPNLYKTHPIMKSYHPKIFLHAEIATILKAKGRVNGCDMFVYREHKDGSPALAMSCSICTEVMKNFGIRRVFYTINELPFYQEADIDILVGYYQQLRKDRVG